MDEEKKKEEKNSVLVVWLESRGEGGRGRGGGGVEVVESFGGRRPDRREGGREDRLYQCLNILCLMEEERHDFNYLCRQITRVAG